MTTAADIGFAEMRLSKAVGVASGEDSPSLVVVLDGVSQDRRLPIIIGSTEALALSASLEGREFPRPISAPSHSRDGKGAYGIAASASCLPSADIYDGFSA